MNLPFVFIFEILDVIHKFLGKKSVVVLVESIAKILVSITVFYANKMGPGKMVGRSGLVMNLRFNHIIRQGHSG